MNRKTVEILMTRNLSTKFIFQFGQMMKKKMNKNPKIVP